VTDDDHINAVEFGNNNVSDAKTMINYGAIDYCFANIGCFCGIQEVHYTVD